MKRTMINEIFFIRAIACLCVVLIHAMTTTQHSYELFHLTDHALYMFKLTIMFATPVFVMISEFLLSYSYPDKLPKSFWKKRILYIFIPYLVMAVIYSAYPLIIGTGFTWGRFMELFFQKTFLGLWHGYFVLIIFQFYALHFLLKKYFDRFPAFLMIGISLIVNLFYLAIYNFSWFHDISLVAGLRDYYKLPFLGWIFYFTVAYYAGKNIDVFLSFLQKYKYYLIAGAVLTGMIPLLMRFNRIYSVVSSKRFDIVLYTFFIFCILYLIARRLKKTPAIVMWISSSSYGIYLLHPLFQFNTRDLMQSLPFYTNFGVHIILLFVIGMGGPILITYLLNKVPYGALIVGKFNTPKKKEKKVAKEPAKAS
ncbi:acyltransferase family protein [Halobacillus karajensis]|uniref:Intercellular adhesion protein C n=1 Tax=Halobacillus karajensis TaxID=195088 RepID=A0A059NV98_9BACI|nr:acyltransferase family protein [Halobacillus karajensis]CDQ18937.1 Intercellular adhesion protein C [Halobacillus karajensis]CDQ22990.1 Intercellular adhesion protein C [Halobacillus karajensis]CDQ26472.1 Intercellular adhesion protein C [Halobacillus karajensis]